MSIETANSRACLVCVEVQEAITVGSVWEQQLSEPESGLRVA